jgi:methyl-accepting chemotaxis protein
LFNHLFLDKYIDFKNIYTPNISTCNNYDEVPPQVGRHPIGSYYSNMTANEEIGKLIVKIIADSEELQDGLEDTSKSMDKVDKSADKTDDAFGKVQVSSDDAAESLKKTGDNADGASSDLDDVTDALKREATAADKAEQSTSDANDQIKQTGDKSKTAKTDTDGFVDQLDDIESATFGTGGNTGVIAALAGIAGGFLVVGTAAKNAADDVEESMREIAIRTGAEGVALEQYGDVVSNLSGSNMGVDPPVIAQVVGSIGQLNKNLAPEQVEDLTKSYIHLGNVMRTSDYAGLVIDLDTAFKKWNVSAEDQADMMNYLQGVYQDTGIPVQDLITNMAEYDDSLRLLGYDPKSAAASLGAAFASQSLDDYTEFLGQMGTLEAQKNATADRDSDVYIQSIFDTAGAYDKQSDAVKALNDEYGLNKTTAGKLFESIDDGVTSYDDLIAKVRELKAELKDTTDLQQKADIESQIDDYNALINYFDQTKTDQMSLWSSEAGVMAQMDKIKETAGAMEDYHAAGAYMAQELGMSYRIIEPFAKSLYSGAESAEAIRDRVDEANVSVEELDKTYRTSAQQWTDMGANVGELLLPIGNLINQRVDTLDQILQQESKEAQVAGLLNVQGWLWGASLKNINDLKKTTGDTSDEMDNLNTTVDKGGGILGDFNTSLSDNATYLYGTRDATDAASTSLTNMGRAGGPIDTMIEKVDTLNEKLQTAITLQTQLEMPGGSEASGSGTGSAAAGSATTNNITNKITINEARTPTQTAKQVSKEIARNAASGLLR